MNNVPRRESSRKGFTSPDGLAFLSKIGPKKRRGGQGYGDDPRKDLKPNVRKLRDGSLVSGSNGNPYPYTTSATASGTTKVEANVIDRHKPSEDF